MNQIESHEWQSSVLFRLVGYGLLLFVLFDLITVLLPPRLMNPVWEFQIIGAIVERVPLPLLGFVLIFYGAENFRSKWEVLLLKILSWAALLIAILLFLLIPLGISNTLRINELNNTQLTTQTTQQMTQLEQFQEQLNKATTNDLQTLLTRVQSQDTNTKDIKNPEDLKKRLLTESNRTQENLKTQAETIRKNKRLELIKSSLKWNLGALIAGILFIRIWQATGWARQSARRRR